MTHALIYSRNCYEVYVTTAGADNEIVKFSIPEYPEDALCRCVVTPHTGEVGLVLQNIDGWMDLNEAQALTDEIEEAQEYAHEIICAIEAAKDIITCKAQRITGYDVHITTGNAEMQHPEHVADALHALAAKIASGADWCTIYDVNGNAVGEMTTTKEDALRETLEALQHRDW